jgi:SAM-dependent methyltransferase
LSPDETWQGEKGRYWAEHADWFTRMLAEFGDALIEGTDLQPGERVLDVGCGNGDVTVAAAEAVGPDGSVVGVDLSTDELDVAAGRAAHRGLSNVELRRADAAADELGSAPFDVLVSRFGVMFFDDPVAAFTNLHRVVNGRLAFVCWQPVERNLWLRLAREAVASVLPMPVPPPGPGPFAFADPDHVRGILTGAGFTDVRFDDVQRPVHFGDSPDDAVGFIQNMDWAKAVLDGAPDDQAAEALAAAREALSAHAGPDGHIDPPGAAWLVTARS